MGAGRRAFFGHAQGGKFGGQSGFLLRDQRFAPDELRFVQCDKDPQSGFQRRAVGRKVGPVERVAHFEAQGIAGAESAGFGARLEDGRPDVPGEGVGEEQFKAGLAGVAGPGGKDRAAAFFHGEEGVPRRHFALEDFAEDARGLRTLHGQSAHGVAAVVDGDAIRRVLLQPGDVLGDLGRVDQEEEIVIGQAVNNQVVDHPAALVEQSAVLGLTVLEARGPV